MLMKMIQRKNYLISSEYVDPDIDDNSDVDGHIGSNDNYAKSLMKNYRMMRMSMRIRIRIRIKMMRMMT